MEKRKVILCGFGQIGRMLARVFSASADFEIVGVVDSDRAIVGENAGALAGIELPCEVVPDIFSFEDGAADIVVITTVSRADDVAELVSGILKKRCAVLTTCEEFAFLSDARPGLAQTLDHAAKEAGVPVLGTGINPGFLMDFLPAVLAVASRDVRKIRVERVQDASARRSQFQKKIGAGLDMAAFEAEKAAGTLRHVGLADSARMLAAAQGWTLESFTEEIVPVVAERDLNMAGAIPVAAGRARGVRQIGMGVVAGRVAVELEFLAAIGEPASYDRIVIDGEPRLESTIAGGVNGDQGTCAVVLNTARLLLGSRRIGLLSMLDLAPGMRKNA